MDFEEVLRKRHSIKRFQEKEISKNIIEKILDLANLSPSAGNLQARSVVIVRNKRMKEKISIAALDQDFIVEAPVIFIICANLEESALKYGKRGRELYSIQDATIFASYLQLAITSLGLASSWVGAFDEDEVKRILGLSERFRPIAIIPVGLAAEEPYLTERKSLDEIINKEI